MTETTNAVPTPIPATNPVRVLSVFVLTQNPSNCPVPSTPRGMTEETTSTTNCQVSAIFREIASIIPIMMPR